MKRLSRLAAGTACSLALTGFAAAQESHTIESFDFPGGSVVEYVELIRDAAPEANFVLMPGAEQFAMPPMKLRNVSLREVAMLISETSTRPISSSSINIKPIGDVFAVQVSIMRYSQPQQPIESLVISLSDIISDELRPEDVLTAIETALELLGTDGPPAEVRFHEATRLLIARGQSSHMVHINDIVAQLRAGIPRGFARGPASAQIPRSVREHEAAIVELREQMTQLQRRLAELDPASDE